MGTTTLEEDIVSSLPPAKLFKALVLDADVVIPKVVPDQIKCSEVVQGDGGPGTIIKFHFAEGQKFKFMTHRIDAIDKKNFSLNYAMIDGDVLSGFIESISGELKVVPSGDGGSIRKKKITYHTKGDEDCSAHALEGKERATATLRAIEAYVLAHPNDF